MTELKRFTFEDLYIGMEVTTDQLSDIYDTYMIIQYESNNDRIGRLVYIGKSQTAEYDEWFMQSKPITPIYNDKEDLFVYDE